MRRDLELQFQARRNLYVAVSTITASVGIVLLLSGLYRIQVGTVEHLIRGGILIAFGLAILLLDKLWLSNAHLGLAVLQELKQLRLESREQKVNTPESPRALQTDTESTFPRFTPKKSWSLWARLNPRLIRGLSILMVVLAAGSVGIYHQTKPVQRSVASGITQVDEWSFVSDETVSARSRILLEHAPATGHFLTIALPYPSARMTAVTSAGNSMAFTQQDWRRYELELPIFPYPSRPQEIIIEWTFKVSSLKRVADGYRTTLSSLVAVDSYRLDVRVPAGSPYGPSGRTGEIRLTPFSSGYQPARGFFGSCKIGIVPRENASGTAAVTEWP
jgi:hypothetical protein